MFGGMRPTEFQWVRRATLFSQRMRDAEVDPDVPVPASPQILMALFCSESRIAPQAEQMRSIAAI